MKRVLRVGVVQGGRIIEERLFAVGERVTVGQSPRCSLVVPSSSVPEELTLLEPSGDGVVLSLTAASEGRLSVGGEVFDFATLRANGMATRQGELFLFPLGEKSRGKVQLGDVTILFQYVVEPAVRPRPRLPSSVRRGWRNNTDRVFASVFLASFAAHLGLVVYLGIYDPPLAHAWDDGAFDGVLAEVPQALTVGREVEPLLSPAQEKASTPEKGPETTPAKPRRVASVARPSEDVARNAAQRRMRMASEVTRSVAALVGARGGQGNMADLLNRGGLGDVESAFDNIGGTQLSNAATEQPGARGAVNNGRLLRVGDLRSSGAQAHEIGSKAPERTVKAVARMDDPSVDGKIDARIVTKEIRSRLRSVQVCYERVLKRDRTLSGKIGLRFTIGVVGSVTAVAIDSDNLGDPSVGDCIKTAVRRWRFPAPKGGPAEVITPMVLQAAS